MANDKVNIILNYLCTSWTVKSNFDICAVSLFCTLLYNYSSFVKQKTINVRRQCS